MGKVMKVQQSPQPQVQPQVKKSVVKPPTQAEVAMAKLTKTVPSVQRAVKAVKHLAKMSKEVRKALPKVASPQSKTQQNAARGSLGMKEVVNKPRQSRSGMIVDMLFERRFTDKQIYDRVAKVFGDFPKVQVAICRSDINNTKLCLYKKKKEVYGFDSAEPIVQLVEA